jgi:hypothetical protein
MGSLDRTRVIRDRNIRIDEKEFNKRKQKGIFEFGFWIFGLREHGLTRTHMDKHG